MEKKYELINEIDEYNGRIIHRIRALKDFGDVKKGELGGYVESEKNLSHLGNCWIYGNAMAFENSVVRDDAVIQHNAKIYGNAKIFQDANILGNSFVYGNAIINGVSVIADNSRVYGNAHICGIAEIYDNAVVCGEPHINKHKISHNAYIRSNTDFMSIDGLGSENRTTYFYRTKNNDIYVICGCFMGTFSEFEEKVKKTYPNGKYGEEYLAMCKVVKIHFKK